MSIKFDQSQLFKKTLAVVVLLSAIIYAWQKTYFDVGSRSGKIYSIEHPQMKYIYTSKERAKVVNEMIHEAFPKIENENYLLAFVEVPNVELPQR